MKYCSNCGTAGEEGARFCSHCGASLERSREKEYDRGLGSHLQKEDPENKATGQQAPVHEYNSSIPSNYSEPISGGLKVVLYILTLFMPLIGIIVGVIYMNDGMEEKKKFGKGLLIFSIIFIALWIIIPIIGFLAFSTFMYY